MRRLNTVKLKTAIFLVLPTLWLQAALCPPAAPASSFAAGSMARMARSNSQGNRAQSMSVARGLSAEARSRIRHAISAVGLILVRGSSDPETRGPRPRGSGVFVRQDGVVVTNFHVIARDKSTELYDEIYIALPVDGAVSVSVTNLHRLNAILINRDLDIAMLRVANENGRDRSVIFPTVEMGDSQAVRELDDVAIIGYPEKGGTTVTVNTGTIEGKDILDNWIKTDARLIHGNSGGAAVDSEGRLIGIPTRVVVDRQPTDKDGDGFPDGFYTLGAVGFLRPSHILRAMLEQIGDATKGSITDPRIATPLPQLTISGVVKSAIDGKPIAGAAVGLTPPGTREPSVKDILTWAYTNSEGQFQLNKLVPPGRYSLQSKTFGYEVFRRDIELRADTPPLSIELRRE